MKHPLCTQTQLHTYCRLRHTSVHLVNGSRLELCSTLSSATQYDDQIHRVSFFFVFVILALLALTEKEQWSFLSGLWEKKKKKNNISKSPVALKSAKEKLHTKHLSWNRKPGAFLCWSTASEHHKARGNTQTDTGDLFFFFFPTAHFSKN